VDLVQQLGVEALPDDVAAVHAHHAFSGGGGRLGHGAWTPDALPDGPPSRRARFGELIAVTVVTAVFVVALLLPPYISPARDAAGQPIGLFSGWLWDSGAIYAFVALVLIGLVTRYLRFYLRWQLPRAIAIVAVDLAAAAALIWVGAIIVITSLADAFADYRRRGLDTVPA
jgi:hypothetical protein